MAKSISPEYRKITLDLDKDSHGWIQFKGTNLCMDVYCKKCGHHSHIDATFAYYVQCPKCQSIYELNGHIQLIDVTGDTLVTDMIIKPELED